nr:RNA-directed DNA polymerase, eukaryota [Tanacetum cinerariifolium]
MDSDSSPVMVLDDSCLNEKDYPLCLMGKVKDFATLANLKVFVANEGLDNIKFKYMGGYWVMMEFQTEVTKLKFQENSVRAKEVPGWIPDFVEDNDEEDDSKVGSYEELPNGEDVKNVKDLEGDSDGEIVHDTKFEEDFLNQKGEEDWLGKVMCNQQSEDPFNIYELLNHKRPVIDKNSNSKELLKYPPGYTPTESHFKKSEVPKSGGSILQLIDDLVKVGETMGASVGNSGGILCVWDPNMFKKTNSTVSDYFVMVRGDWMPNGKKLLIDSVYAPQELSEKKMLWDYLSLVMSKWEGEVVIMGDFNEVRNKSEKFGTLFNRHGADVFNRFISNTGLEEVPLKGCSFTWCHRSATKMSKLGRFLISDSLLCSCPNISSITLDRYLSDHRPILMREDAPVIESNALVRMLKKLKYLKEKIHMWNKLNKEKSHKSKRSLLAELADCDTIIDKGVGENNVVNRRTKVVNLLQEVEKKNSLEAAQKAKIKWAVEGDEDSSIIMILANRLVVVSGGLVNEIQSAFVDDKQILDGPFIFNELVQWCKKKNKQSLVFKVDFEKAYDSVRWDHLDNIMRKFGFGEKWLDVGLFKGIELAHSLNLSHMFYADDAIFMGQWSESNIDTIVKVLDCFNRASGLRINITKSKLLGISVEDDKVKQAAARIGCNTLKTPFSYLGSKVGGCMSRIQSWNETIKRMEYRLSRWKLKTLSISKKSVWVKWKHALASKDNGGLGVSSLFALNRALMFKQSKGEVLLSLVMVDIIHEVEMFKSCGIDLVICAGNSKKIDVASKLSHLGLDVSFRHPPRGGVEIQQFKHMKEKVEGCILVDMMDIWFWALEGSGEFTITSVRKMIDDFMLPEVSSKTRWIKAVPIKVNVHAWKVKLDGLPTRLNISRRGIDIESILRLMCGKAVESTSHIFFTCQMSKEILRKISRWWDIDYI